MTRFTRAPMLAVPLFLCALAACGDSAGPPDPEPLPADRTSPVVSLTAPGEYSPATLRIAGEARDSGGVARVTYQVDAGAEQQISFRARSPADSSIVFFDAPISLSSGAHSVVVYAYDRAGNRGNSSTASVKTDATPPVIRLATPEEVRVAADTVRIRSAISDENALRSVEVSIGAARPVNQPDVRVAQVALDTLVTVPVGSSEVVVTAIDVVGNSASARVRVTRTAAASPARFDAISSAVEHGCGVRGTTAFCWGEGGDGRLGNGRRISRDTPVPVSGELAFTSVSAGNESSCGLTSAGAVYCWGAGYFAALGTGAAPQLTAAPEKTSATASFARLGSIAYHTVCALTAEGEAFCWGRNATGQAGVPPSSGSCNVGGNLYECVRAPMRVQGGLRFSSISAGTSATCAVATDGRGFCWGSAGIAGAQSGGAAFTDTPSPVPGGLTFRGISVANLHACGVTAAGEAYCWGSNADGALGDGTTTNRAQPVPVATTLRFRSVGTGYTSRTSASVSCGLAEDGTVHCWGNGRTRPAPLEGGLTFTAMSPDHRCGLAADRAAYCWGDSLRPVPVPGDY